jgi:mannose-1-phosphate guanylyltransferase/mannose-6-phosphate isomerase
MAEPQPARLRGMSGHVVPVIMAGGAGTRLWPLSRALYPKQFLALHGRETLFQQAVQRVAALAGDGIEACPPCVVCNDEHRFLVRDQLHEIGVDDASLLLEPAGRNTAPAMTLAALHCVPSDDGIDPILVVTPADQTVTQPAAFVRALRDAVRAADDGAIVVLGVTPDRPETGYGYIRAGAPIHGLPARAVASFVEKPDRVRAEAYLAAGDHYWNSGLFVVRASVWLAALARLRPDIAETTRAAWRARTVDNGFVRPGRAEFLAIPGESVDYAVMETCGGAGFSVRMVSLDAGWSDLGAWDAVWQLGERDADGNATHGDVLIEASRNTLVHATRRLVGAVGVEDVVIVETPDAVLVADRARAQDVKAVVGRLAAARRSEGSVHRRVHRPWGWYDSIDAGPRFQVKRIMVKPGASLSLQMHHHRAEHWVVVSGTAEVTCGERRLLLGENQSTYIPLGEKHRLANPGTIPLEIIEVQSGSYLGEDDIVRFEDHYGRIG